MDRVAAEVAQEVGVFLQNGDVYASAGKQKTEHQAGGSAAGDATAGLQGFGRNPNDPPVQAR
jgi:hypothetical protein